MKTAIRTAVASLGLLPVLACASRANFPADAVRAAVLLHHSQKSARATARTQCVVLDGFRRPSPALRAQLLPAGLRSWDHCEWAVEAIVFQITAVDSIDSAKAEVGFKEWSPPGADAHFGTLYEKGIYTVELHDNQWIVTGYRPLSLR